MARAKVVPVDTLVTELKEADPAGRIAAVGPTVAPKLTNEVAKSG